MSLDQVKKLQRRVERLISLEEDRGRYYPLCVTDQDRMLIDGYGEVSQDWDDVMVESKEGRSGAVAPTSRVSC